MHTKDVINDGKLGISQFGTLKDRIQQIMTNNPTRKLCNQRRLTLSILIATSIEGGAGQLAKQMKVFTLQPSQVNAPKWKPAAGSSHTLHS